jgi:hypothetical protein
MMAMTTNNSISVKPFRLVGMCSSFQKTQNESARIIHFRRGPNAAAYEPPNRSESARNEPKEKQWLQWPTTIGCCRSVFGRSDFFSAHLQTWAFTTFGGTGPARLRKSPLRKHPGSFPESAGLAVRFQTESRQKSEEFIFFESFLKLSFDCSVFHKAGWPSWRQGGSAEETCGRKIDGQTRSTGVSDCLRADRESVSGPKMAVPDILRRRDRVGYASA